MRIRTAICGVVLAALPRAAAADRGALTLELGPAFSIIGASPSQGSGSMMLATGGGGSIGARYGLSNELELAATASWEAPADYYHSGVEVGTGGTTVSGTLVERTQRYGALVGARYVRGYVWRIHVGGDIGWMRESFSHRDLLDVSDPGNVHSFGLGLPDRTEDALVIAPVAGVEWQFADHWSLSVMPRLQLLIGGANRVGLLVPVSVGYSWYLF